MITRSVVINYLIRMSSLPVKNEEMIELVTFVSRFAKQQQKNM